MKTFNVPPTSRFNVAVDRAPAAMCPNWPTNRSARCIESTQPIVVERSLYTNANGVTWAAGTNATATRLP